MKRLIIILELIMMLFNKSDQGSDQSSMTTEKTPQTTITKWVERMFTESPREA